MKKIDVIILSNTANVEFYNILKACVLSIKQSQGVDANIIVVETNKKLKGKDLKLPIDVFYIPDDKIFNYNRYLNYGLTFCKGENICISNNDVIYDRNTLEVLINYLDKYDSVSPWDLNSSKNYYKEKGIYEGYSTGSHITGWCIVTKQSTIQKIGGKFDEQFSFWCQDDDYSMLLKSNNLKHALIGDVSVLHTSGQSHKLFDQSELHKQTLGLQPLFFKKWGK